jgi:hypothetical protein
MGASVNNLLEDYAVNNGETYICLVDDPSGLAKPGRAASPRSHSFTPLISTFAADQWRKVSEGMFTHVWPSGESPSGENGYRIRLSVDPALADDLLRTAVPIIVSAECPFKVIANSALLELAGSRSSSGESAGDFMTIYPATEQLFNDLTAKLQRATKGINGAAKPIPMAETSTRAELTPDNPWPGLDYYLPGEFPYFHGRQDEQLELARRLDREVVTVVLGQPGVGKSSLLRAGLKPHFDRMRFEPVYLRLQLTGAVHPVQQVRDEINRVLRERRINGAPFGEGQTLWGYFHQQESSWTAADGKPVEPVLIFDQFENVFTFDGAAPAARQQVEAFWTQIAQLAEGRVPQTIGQLTLPSADFGTDRPAFKVVISLRQDHLPELLARRGQMPSLTQNHFLLQAFNGRKAVEAVLGPGRPLFDSAQPAALAEQIVRRVARKAPAASERPAADREAIEPLETVRVEPALLSFFCQQLNEARKRPGATEPGASLITANLVDAAAGRMFEDFSPVGDKAPPAAPATPEQATDRNEGPAPDAEILPEPTSESRAEAPLAAQVLEQPSAEAPVAALETQVATTGQIARPEPEVEKLPAPTSEQPEQPPAVVQVLEPQFEQAPILALSTQAPSMGQVERREPEEERLPQATSGHLEEATLPVQVSPRPLAEAPRPVLATQTQSVGQRVGQEPEQAALPGPTTPRSEALAVPAQTGDYAVRRLKYLAIGLGMLSAILLAVMVVTYIDEVQQKQTEVQLSEYVANLAAARNTFKAANNRITLTEANLAIKESNLLSLAEQTRRQELATRSALEQNAKLAGEQTNFQSRILELNREKVEEESRLMQSSNLLFDLTNEIAKLKTQKEELNKEKEDLKVRRTAPVVTNNDRVLNLFEDWLARSKNGEINPEAAAMQSIPETLPATATPVLDPSARRYADVLLTNGQCFYSGDGAIFRVLHLHDVLYDGAVVRTGKESWADLFVRKTGTTVRLGPESELRVVKLSDSTENGVRVTDSLLELRKGRIFTVVRALEPGCTLEITDAGGHSVITGGGLGCYMIAAPGPNTGDKLSLTPLRIMSQRGSSIIVAGQEYNGKEGTTLSLLASPWETMLIQLDELEAETDKAIAEPQTPASPKSH